MQATENLKVQLTGSILGVESCQITTDSDEVRVGSSLDTDLVIMDPLVPPMAFVVRRQRRHSTDSRPCEYSWVIEVHPQARVFVNERLTTRESLMFGEAIASGCHRFVFAPADPRPRNRKSNTAVNDLCAALLKEQPLPPGYLKTCPWRRHAQRLRQALAGAGALAVIALLLFFIAPRAPKFESTQPPMEVMVLADRIEAPAPDAVRPLKDVQRQTVAPAALPGAALPEKAAPAMPELAAQAQPVEVLPDQELPQPPPTIDKLDPVDMQDVKHMPQNISREPDRLASAVPRRQAFSPAAMPEATAANKPAPVVAELAANAHAVATDDSAAPPSPAPKLPQTRATIAALAPAERKAAEHGDESPRFSRNPIRLAATAPPRRLTRAEAADKFKIELNPAQVQAAAPVQLKASSVATATGNGIQIPDRRALDSDKARRLELLAVFKPSPVRFENAGGVQVPVARMSEALAPLESVKSGDYQIDGKVTESEIAKSWKSGRFRVHAPGNPPPEANPATYCYVGRSELGGKPCLYISFICADPNPDQIIANISHNLTHPDQQIIFDDSLEIFLDTNNDRRDYNQLIVNARGAYYAAYFASTEAYNQNQGRAWDPQATVKSSINREAGQWICEILIPFERLGGIPAKGKRWTVNFCRNFRGQKENWQLQSWFNVYTKSRDFHKPANFGMFEW